MSGLQDFKKVRWFQNINLFLQILLCVLFVFGFNWLGSTHYFRKDITKNHQYTLSPETVAYIQNIDQHVRVIVTITPDPANPEAERVYNDLQRLIKEYEYIVSDHPSGFLEGKFINVFQQKQEAEALHEEFGITQENVIIVATDKTHKEVQAADLYDVKNGIVEAFNGERVLTSAIVDVTQENQKVVYFTQGHGEMSPQDVNPLRGLSEVSQLLQDQNYAVKLLDLTEVTEVPSDADIIIISAPQLPFLSFEADKLDSYLTRNNGRVLLLMSPRREHGLDDILYRWGVLSEDRIIIDIGADFQQSGSDFLVKHFAEHPITQQLIDYKLGVVVGLMRPVRKDPASDDNVGIVHVPLMASSEMSWAKRFILEGGDLSYDPEYDTPGPLSVAMLAERRVNSDFGLSIAGGRLLVFGSGDFIANHRLHALGNQMLFLSAVHWMIESDGMLNIPPKKIERYQLDMPKNAVMRLGYRMFAIPCSVAILGAIVYYLRQRR